MKTLSRRSLLQGIAVSALGTALPSRAQAPARPAVVIVFLPGGYNAVFTATDVYVSGNIFGATASGALSLGNGLVVDRETFGQLPSEVLSRMACIGAHHGLTAHNPARRALFSNAAGSYPIRLAQAMNSGSALSCAAIGGMPPGTHLGVPGVTMTTVSDVTAPARLIAGWADADEPLRGSILRGVAAARSISRSVAESSPQTLRAMSDGYSDLYAALAQPPRPVDWMSIAARYGIENAATEVDSTPAKFAAAELMVDLGADVICVTVGAPRDCSAGWDTHGDSGGTCTRGLMKNLLMPPLSTFLMRNTLRTDREVTTIVLGEFSRTTPVNDHAPYLSASVFGPRVRNGTSGRPLSPNALPPGASGHDGLWAFLAAAARVESRPFGANPHPFLG